MARTIYGLTYCEDDGSRESYNWSYMPIELFEDESIREQRKAILAKKNPLLEFEEWTSTTITDATQGFDDADQSEHKDDMGEAEPDLLSPAGSNDLALPSADPKVLICRYEMADEASPRNIDLPITLHFSWSDGRADCNLSTEETQYDKLLDFADNINQIQDRLSADAIVMCSKPDISIVATDAKNDDQPESNAWIMIIDGHSVDEDFGDVPEHAEICRIFRTGVRIW